MVNASNGYAGGEPDLAIPVARSPQIRARLGKSPLQTPALRGQIPTERHGEPKSKLDQGFGIDCNQDMIRLRGGSQAMASAPRPKTAFRDPFLLPVCDCGGPMNLASLEPHPTHS